MAQAHAPYTGDVALQKDRIAYVGPHAPHGARERLDARGKAVAPGFINMLAHPEESLIADGRALSDLRQGVTLEVIGEDSMGPLNAEMKRLDLQRQGDIKYDDRLDHARGLPARNSSGAGSPRISLPTWGRARCASTC